MNVEEILEKLVSFNTIKDYENEKIILFIEDFLKQYDFKTIKKDRYLIMESNFGKEDEYGLGFVGHTDTVEVVGDWKYNPFKLIKENNKLYGLGTCDMKGGIAAMLSTLSLLDKKKINKKIKVYFTYDEEIGFRGIKEVTKYEDENKAKIPNRFIIGEPTNNEMLLGSKGLLEYKVSFYGKKVHSSVPEKGKSAIMLAVDFINELKNFYEENIREEYDYAYSVPYTTFNVGVIRGGSEINSVAENAEILFDFRTINKNEKKVIEFVDFLTKKYDAKKEVLNNISAFLNESNLVVSNIKTCSFITEASFLEGERIILGPGPVNPHEKNEYITVESLNKCVKQYLEIINKSCL